MRFGCSLLAIISMAYVLCHGIVRSTMESKSIVEDEEWEAERGNNAIACSCEDTSPVPGNLRSMVIGTQLRSIRAGFCSSTIHRQQEEFWL